MSENVTIAVITLIDDKKNKYYVYKNTSKIFIIEGLDKKTIQGIKKSGWFYDYQIERIDEKELNRRLI